MDQFGLNTSNTMTATPNTLDQMAAKKVTPLDQFRVQPQRAPPGRVRGQLLRSGTQPGMDILMRLPVDLQLDMFSRLEPCDITRVARSNSWFREFLKEHFLILLKQHLPDWLPEICMKKIYKRRPGITSTFWWPSWGNTDRKYTFSCVKCLRPHFDPRYLKPLLRHLDDDWGPVVRRALPDRLDRSLSTWEHIWQEVQHFVCARELLFQNIDVQVQEINTRLADGEENEEGDEESDGDGEDSENESDSDSGRSRQSPKLDLHHFTSLPKIRYFLRTCLPTASTIAFMQRASPIERYVYILDLNRPADAEHILHFMMDRLFSDVICGAKDTLILLPPRDELDFETLGQVGDVVIGPRWKLACGGAKCEIKHEEGVFEKTSAVCLDGHARRVREVLRR